MLDCLVGGRPLAGRLLDYLEQADVLLDSRWLRTQFFPILIGQLLNWPAQTVVGVLGMGENLVRYS